MLNMPEKIYFSFNLKIYLQLQQVAQNKFISILIRTESEHLHIYIAGGSSLLTNLTHLLLNVCFYLLAFEARIADAMTSFK